MKKFLVLSLAFLFIVSALALAQSGKPSQPQPVVSASGEVTARPNPSTPSKGVLSEGRVAAGGGPAVSRSGSVRQSVSPDGRTVLRSPRRTEGPLADQLCIDDGVMASPWAWSLGGNAWAVRYTAPIYPALIESVQVYIFSEGDPYWPWPDSVHQPFAICVFDEAAGQPGTEVFRDTVQADSIPPSWVMAYPNVIIMSGDFWVAAEQFGDFPDCEAVCVDSSEDHGPQNWQHSGGIWGQTSGLGGDLMICAFVSPFDTSRVIVSGNSAAPPTIDGIIDSVEWAEATVRDVSDFFGVPDVRDAPGSAFLYVKNDEMNLYIALDAVWDTSSNDWDDFSPYFDDNNDGEWPAAPDTSEGGLWFSNQASGDMTTWRYFESGFIPGPIRNVGFPVGVDFSSGHQQFEGVVPFGTLPEELQAVPGDTVGFFTLSYHDNASEIYAWWPYDTPIFYDPAGYGDLILAPGLPPVITQALASDNVDSIPGIDADDYVLLTFDEATNKPVIDWGNVDNVLQLSGGHTWLDGFGNIGSAVWNGAGDRLMITLSTTISPPTVAVGDTITPDGVTVTDTLGNACVSVIEITGSFGEPIGVDEVKARPTGSLVFALSQSSPNPFASETEIRYSVPVKSGVSLRVYDLSGRLVRTLVDAETEPGIHAARWDGRDEAGSCVPAGVYIYRLAAGSSILTRKMIVLR